MVVGALLACALLLAPLRPAEAARISFIRDAEIENIIRQYATPVFEVAGLSPQAVEIHLVNDKALNAFVAGGQKLFLNTGLLIRAENPGEVIGVIAHETGHIAGGHLARAQEELRNASNQAILAMVLGAAAAAATGRGDVGAAVTAGTAGAVERGFLHYSQTQESSADQAAVKFLDQSGQSARGLLHFFEILGGQELLVSARQDPYLRTHPLTRDRISFIQAHVEKSRFSDARWPAAFDEMHERMRAKLFAFMESPARTLSRYKPDDKSIAARYARAVAFYRKPDLTNALAAVDSLIAERPNDPYFQELKGQMLFENGRAAESLGAYRRSVELLPDSALLLLALGQVELELNDPALLESAQAHLNRSLRLESRNSFAWEQLAIAYGRSDNAGMTSFALAESGLLTGDVEKAAYHAERALRLLPKNSPYWLRANDIQSAVSRARESRNR